MWPENYCSICGKPIIGLLYFTTDGFRICCRDCNERLKNLKNKGMSKNDKWCEKCANYKDKEECPNEQPECFKPKEDNGLYPLLITEMRDAFNAARKDKYGTYERKYETFNDYTESERFNMFYWVITEEDKLKIADSFNAARFHKFNENRHYETAWFLYPTFEDYFKSKVFHRRTNNWLKEKGYKI